jgi:hypothetical protein
MSVPHRTSERLVSDLDVRRVACRQDTTLGAGYGYELARKLIGVVYCILVLWFGIDTRSIP